MYPFVRHVFVRRGAYVQRGVRRRGGSVRGSVRVHRGRGGRGGRAGRASLKGEGHGQRGLVLLRSQCAISTIAGAAIAVCSSVRPHCHHRRSSPAFLPRSLPLLHSVLLVGFILYIYIYIFSRGFRGGVSVQFCVRCWSFIARFEFYLPERLRSIASTSSSVCLQRFPSWFFYLEAIANASLQL